MVTALPKAPNSSQRIQLNQGRLKTVCSFPPREFQEKFQCPSVHPDDGWDDGQLLISLFVIFHVKVTMISCI